MSETASFVDPVFLARFGLSRVNLIDYFLHPLNPFRTPNNTSNEVLNMQGISIGMLMQPSLGHIPLSPMAAEEAYAKNLSKLTGDQYELLPPSDPNDVEQYTLPSPLYAIRHVIRTSPRDVKIVGVYYVVEGVIYKSPAIRSLMKSNISRTLDGLAGMSCFCKDLTRTIYLQYFIPCCIKCVFCGSILMLSANQNVFLFACWFLQGHVLH